MTKQKLLLIGFVLALLLSPFTSFSEETKYKSYTDIGPIEKTDLTIKQVVSDPDIFHREVITVEGVISKIEYKKLFTGRKFTLFGLEDANQNTINVYARGYVKEIKEGSEVRIYGRYSKEKSFLFKKHKNIMKARKIHFL
ncbi:MAG: hypothetical protein IID03_07850 [Candidatus Dadabacteria bacterium]|nr:hypothetical protein [Candidatus Dadabacteria bacterium]